MPKRAGNAKVTIQGIAIGYRTEEHDLRKESSGSSGLALTIEVAA